ncbi:hypothetical protein CVV38_01250 [Candidatus Peregrinibacteria bacterium HGW-Peregrinibacteria-1]|jgi:TRAP-type C4-dicarboxylate transport system permease small subunit|nr:MAG: hypothetical protein CVV38_01250 [Candidatus Peregrinibacteria bacterium HGW-Peregrinibacteria-1]
MKLNTSSIKQFLMVFAIMVGAISLFSVAPLAEATQLTTSNDNILGGETSLRQVVLNIVNFALGFLGLLAVIMIIYAGFLYVTAAGNQENVDNAKKIIMYAIIGIIIILISFAIVNTVLVATESTDTVGPGTTL